MATPYRHTLLALSITLAATAAHAQDATLDTVTVVGEQATDYQANKAAVAGFDNAPLLDTPASVAVITEARLKDQQARLLSEVLKNDASVGGRAIVDASIGWRIAEGYELQVSGTNLLDKKYVSTVGTNGFSNRGDSQTLMIGAPRQVFATLKAAF